MLEHIRKHYPQAAITVVCQQHIAELYEACPYVDGVLTFDRHRFTRKPFYREIIFKRMQAVKADLALDSVYSRGTVNSLLLAECGARRKIGIDGDTSNISSEQKKLVDACYTELVATHDGIISELVRHQQFLEGIGITTSSLMPSIWTTSDDVKFAESFFTSHNMEQESTIALFPGAQYDVKNFGYFGEALAEVCRNRGFNVIGLGSLKDSELSQRQLDVLDVPTINLCGKVTLRQTAELLRRCKLAVGVDSALAHLACAVGTPNVIILGGGHFGRFLPYSPLTSVVCLPLECYGCNWICRYDRPYCVQGIVPEVFLLAINESLQCNSENPRVHVQQEVSWEQFPGRPGYKDTSLNFINIPADVYFYKLR
jgi:ADP-heptose:LPS heptosyltransferase